MGLHLNYELRLPGSATSEFADQMLDHLRASALQQDFEEVSRVVGPRNTPPRDGWDAALSMWAEIIANPYDEDEPPLPGDPTTARAFFTNPGRGCETASFGFLRRADEQGGQSEWFWHYSCKTQYASVLGDDHLVKCHVGLVAVLDRAIQLGIDVVVHDETHYWETRDRSRLLSEVAQMNRIVACFAGALDDALGENLGDHKVQASIFEHPRFERLEMGDE